MKTPNLHRNQGVALIIVLSFVVLVTVVVIAFLSRAQLNSQIAAVSGGGVQADSVVKSAIDTIVDDLRAEIKAGSPTPVTVNGQSIYPPNLTSRGTLYPARNAEVRNIPNLVRISQAKAFYGNIDGLSGYSANGPIRGAGASTVVSANKRHISQARWKAAMLVPDNLTIPTPAWIYVTQQGDMGINPANNSTLGESNFALLKVDGDRPAVGRYAFAIYDVGGLLDINVAGNTLPAGHAGNQHRGRLHHANIDGFTGITKSGFEHTTSGLPAWRNQYSKSLTTDAEGSGSLFDPKRDFIKVNATTSGLEQIFLTRQDLIAYATAGHGGLTLAALPHLTIYTREKNAPVWNSTATSTPALDLPFNVSAKLKQRFPLSRIALLAGGANVSEIATHFNLTWDDTEKVWIYGDRNTAVTIRNLATIPDGETPNFFEILKSVIAPTSLGTMAGGVGTHVGDALTPAQKLDAQILQIGANIIDQFDGDNYPTDIFANLADSSIQNMANRFIGIEDLPYLAQVAGAFQTSMKGAGTPEDPAKKVITAWLLPRLVKLKAPLNNNGPITDIRIRPAGQAALLGGTLPAGKTFGVADARALSFSTLDADVTAAWSGGNNKGEIAAGAPAGGFLIGEADVPSGASGIEYKLMPGDGLGAGTPLTLILEYHHPDDDAGKYRPYAIWNGLKVSTTGAPNELKVPAAANGDYPFNPALAPGWSKTDPRTDRIAVTLTTAPTMNLNAPFTPPVSNHLDRAFRGVGELGYAFRDEPSTSIRLGEINSPDAAILDFFTVDDNEIIGGRLALSSRSPDALRAMLLGTAANSTDTAGIVVAEANRYVNALLALNNANPPAAALQNRGELVTNLATKGTASEAIGRQAPARALAEVGNARTWNLMIDVIAQAGRVPKNVTSGTVSEKFVVEGERRYWIHVAIDRYTGQEVGSRIVEVVKE